MATKYAGYIYDSNKKLILQGELLKDTDFSSQNGLIVNQTVYKMQDTLPTINQGDSNTTQIVAAVANGTYPTEQPFITIATPKNWKTGLLACEKDVYIIVQNAGEATETYATYQVAAIDLDLIGMTIYGGIHAF